jgi:hypothetical protein
MIVKVGKHEVEIDEEDAHLLSKEAGFSFQVQDRSSPNYMRFYVKARRNRHGKERPYLHRLILNAPKHMQVDHINGDGRDNRKCNLRLVTRSRNMANQRRPVGASGYRGVVQSNGDCNAWSVRLTVNGKPIYSCGHATPEDAARARDALALEHFGEHAVLNFPPEGHAQADHALVPNNLTDIPLEPPQRLQPKKIRKTPEEITAWRVINGYRLRWSATQTARLLELHSEGYSPKEISALLEGDYTPGAIFCRLRTLGKTNRRNPAREAFRGEAA